MSEDLKKRIAHAIERYEKKQLKEALPPSRRNNKPEKLVESECMDWMRLRGWNVKVYEAKATYDPRIRIYRQQSMQAGVADCMGNLPDGVACVVEFKAKGKLSTFARPENYRQRDFLVQAIHTGAFACVVDSADLLQGIHNEWKRLRDRGELTLAKRYLIEMLPKRRGQK